MGGRGGGWVGVESAQQTTGWEEQGASRGKGMSAVARTIDAHSTCHLRPEADFETSIEHLSVKW